MVVRLSQVIDIDLLPNIEITAEQVSFEWSHHSWFLFNDSIDREQNSAICMGLLLVFLAHYLTVSFQSLIRIVKYYSHWVFNFWGRNDYFELIAPFGSNTNGDGHCHWMEM